MKVLFWNTHKNEKINWLLSDIVIENNISVVVLAEYKASMNELIEILEKQGRKMHEYITIGCERIKIIGSINTVEPGRQSQYVSMQIINNKDILCCLHLPSQIYSGNCQMRDIIIDQIVADIRATEIELNTENTMVVGDFNINPYDTSCIGAQFFHSLPVFAETERKSRVVAQREFYMFYNPMWNFLGDFTRPYGTFYYGGSNSINTYWNLFDQVIIRPALRDRFIDDSLKILTETQSKCLLNNKGHPDKTISDHLPIMFEIREDYYGEKA